jgi:hypothetical protein
LFADGQPATLNKPKWKYTRTMSKDTRIGLKKPEYFVDEQITEILRQGAVKFLVQTL